MNFIAQVLCATRTADLCYLLRDTVAVRRAGGGDSAKYSGKVSSSSTSCPHSPPIHRTGLWIWRTEIRCRFNLRGRWPPRISRAGHFVEPDHIRDRERAMDHVFERRRRRHTHTSRKATRSVSEPSPMMADASDSFPWILRRFRISAFRLPARKYSLQLRATAALIVRPAGLFNRNPRRSNRC